MIDSSYNDTLYDAIQQFREHITQNYGSDSIVAKSYIQIADGFQRYVSDKDPLPSPELAIQEYYSLTVGVPPFEAPPSKSKERCARSIRMIQDFLHNEVPKRRYISHPIKCPASYPCHFLQAARKYPVLLHALRHGLLSFLIHCSC